MSGKKLTAFNQSTKHCVSKLVHVTFSSDKVLQLPKSCQKVPHPLAKALSLSHMNLPIKAENCTKRKTNGPKRSQCHHVKNFFRCTFKNMASGLNLEIGMDTCSWHSGNLLDS